LLAGNKVSSYYSSALVVIKESNLAASVPVPNRRRAIGNKWTLAGAAQSAG